MPLSCTFLTNNKHIYTPLQCEGVSCSVRGMEARFQTKVKKWLERKGAVVLVISPQPGIPTGFPDVLALLPGGGFMALELKRSKTAKHQPLQDYWVERLGDMYYSAFVYPEIWDKVKEEIERDYI